MLLPLFKGAIKIDKKANKLVVIQTDTQKKNEKEIAVEEGIQKIKELKFCKENDLVFNMKNKSRKSLGLLEKSILQL